MYPENAESNTVKQLRFMNLK